MNAFYIRVLGVIKKLLMRNKHIMYLCYLLGRKKRNSFEKFIFLFQNKILRK